MPPHWPEGARLGLDHPVLAGVVGAGVRVAVVDSGVHGDHPHVGGIQGGVGFMADGRVVPDHVDQLGHGTAVAAAVREKAPAVEVYAVRVFHDELSTSARALVKAIDWATERGTRLINLSLGTPNPAHEAELAAAVARADAAGSIVVSAAEQDGRPAWPGILDDSVGVLLDWSVDRDALRLTRDHRGGAALAASGYPRPIPGIPPKKNLAGISFSVANVTGVLARVLEAEPRARRAAGLLEVLSAYAWPVSADGP
jgi:subtilisin family serine protease